MDRRNDRDNWKPETAAFGRRAAAGRKNRNRGSQCFEWWGQRRRFLWQQWKLVRKNRHVHGRVHHVLGRFIRAYRKHRNSGITIQAAPAHNMLAVREDLLTGTQRELLLRPVNLLSVAVRDVSRKIFLQFHFVELRHVNVGVVGTHVRSAHGQLGFVNVRRAARHDGVGIYFAGLLHQNGGSSIDNVALGSDDSLLRIETGLRIPVPHHPHSQRTRHNADHGDAEHRKIPNALQVGWCGGKY
jgi:hypothetical protein